MIINLLIFIWFVSVNAETKKNGTYGGQDLYQARNDPYECPDRWTLMASLLPYQNCFHEKYGTNSGNLGISSVNQCCYWFNERCIVPKVVLKLKCKVTDEKQFRKYRVNLIEQLIKDCAQNGIQISEQICFDAAEKNLSNYSLRSCPDQSMLWCNTTETIVGSTVNSSNVNETIDATIEAQTVADIQTIEIIETTTTISEPAERHKTSTIGPNESQNTGQNICSSVQKLYIWLISVAFLLKIFA